MSNIDYDLLAKKIVEKMPEEKEKVCLHGITKEDGESLKYFAKFWKQVSSTAIKSGITALVLFLITLLGYGILFIFGGKVK